MSSVYVSISDAGTRTICAASYIRDSSMWLGCDRTMSDSLRSHDPAVSSILFSLPSNYYPIPHTHNTNNDLSILSTHTHTRAHKHAHTHTHARTHARTHTSMAFIKDISQSFSVPQRLVVSFQQSTRADTRYVCV